MRIARRKMWLAQPESMLPGLLAMLPPPLICTRWPQPRKSDISCALRRVQRGQQN